MCVLHHNELISLQIPSPRGYSEGWWMDLNWADPIMLLVDPIMLSTMTPLPTYIPALMRTHLQATAFTLIYTHKGKLVSAINSSTGTGLVNLVD